MYLTQALRLNSYACVALVGAGGKTTTLFQIASELSPPVLVTATTHLGAWQTSTADQHIIAEDLDALQNIELRGITLVTGAIADQRAGPVSESVLNHLHDLAHKNKIPLLIEADGSRQKSLKAPAAHEPPIPNFVDVVVVLAGINALGKPLNDSNVHRAELFSQLAALSLNMPITAQALETVLTHPQGGLKNIPPNARRILLLNKADTSEQQSMAQSMSTNLLSSYDSVIIASLKENLIHAAHERCAGIILAAGESKRYGSPKQLLDWKGKPFVRQVAETALRAGLEPVVVVTGAYAAEIESALKGLPVVIVHNESWQDGQSTSIKSGVHALQANIGSAIFLLADQPQIPVEVIRALVETHAQELSPIVVPLVLEEKRGNPVLFDKVTFPNLFELQGDIGGRGVFHKHIVEFMPWHDDKLLLDVDKPEDYARLLSDDTL